MRNPGNLHGYNIFDVEVLQRCDVGVFTFVCLQDQLLNDPVQQQPVVKPGAALLVCRHTEESAGVKDNLNCRRLAGSRAYMASGGSAAAPTGGEGTPQCASLSSWSDRTSGRHFSFLCGPEEKWRLDWDWKERWGAHVCFMWLTTSKRLDIRSSSSFLNISKKSRCLETTIQGKQFKGTAHPEIKQLNTSLSSSVLCCLSIQISAVANVCLQYNRTRWSKLKMKYIW